MPENQTGQTLKVSSQQEQQNWRTHKRYTCKVNITLSSESNFYNGFTENISYGGLFVATYDLQPLGGILNLELNIPGCSEPIRVRGQIRWIRVYNDMTPDIIPGMGVKFIDLEERARIAIESFTALKEPLFFDDEA